MNKYTIGDKEYSRQELLDFGKRHYPKFYWIKRGIGIGFMFISGIALLSFILMSIEAIQIMNEHPEIRTHISHSEVMFFTLYAVFGIMFIVGLVLFIVSFKSLPDKSYIKHAVDYYTRQAEIDRRRVTSSARVKEKEDVRELIKYKELLDAGAITQEEYDAKKKELL